MMIFNRKAQDSSMKFIVMAILALAVIVVGFFVIKFLVSLVQGVTDTCPESYSCVEGEDYCDKIYKVDDSKKLCSSPGYVCCASPKEEAFIKSTKQITQADVAGDKVHKETHYFGDDIEHNITVEAFDSEPTGGAKIVFESEPQRFTLKYGQKKTISVPGEGKYTLEIKERVVEGEVKSLSVEIKKDVFDSGSSGTAGDKKDTKIYLTYSRTPEGGSPTEYKEVKTGTRLDLDPDDKFNMKITMTNPPEWCVAYYSAKLTNDATDYSLYKNIWHVWRVRTDECASFELKDIDRKNLEDFKIDVIAFADGDNCEPRKEFDDSAKDTKIPDLCWTESVAIYVNFGDKTTPNTNGGSTPNTGTDNNDVNDEGSTNEGVGDSPVRQPDCDEVNICNDYCPPSDINQNTFCTIPDDQVVCAQDVCNKSSYGKGCEFTSLDLYDKPNFGICESVCPTNVKIAEGDSQCVCGDDVIQPGSDDICIADSEGKLNKIDCDYNWIEKDTCDEYCGKNSDDGTCDYLEKTMCEEDLCGFYETSSCKYAGGVCMPENEYPVCPTDAVITEECRCNDDELIDPNANPYEICFSPQNRIKNIVASCHYIPIKAYPREYSCSDYCAFANRYEDREECWSGERTLCRADVCGYGQGVGCDIQNVDQSAECIQLQGPPTP